MSVKKLEIVNKKANFNYHIEQKFVAGIMLTGSEVKSIRLSHCNISDAYCIIDNGELKIKNMHISEFKQASIYNHEPLRIRTLLLQKKELKKIDKYLKDVGTAVFPIKLFLSERQFIKLEIGIGRGKKSFDKREDIKEKDIKRDLQRLK